MTDTTYEVVQVPLDEIYDDPEWNCRHQILTRVDVVDLIESIKTTRLENPVVIQPVEDITAVTPVPPGVKYRALNGNRRFVAMRCLHKDDPSKYSTIPAIVRRGLDDDAARSLNITDNLARKNLNVVQEALSLKYWYDRKYPRDTIGRMIGQSGSWVQIRFNVLDLPVGLHEYMSKGWIGQNDIKDLYTYRNDMDALFARAKEIISYRMKGSAPPRVRSKRQQARAKKKGRSRSNVEIIELITHVGQNVGVGLLTRLMAWCAGNVTTFEIITEIKDTTEALDKEYTPLDEDQLEHL